MKTKLDKMIDEYLAMVDAANDVKTLKTSAKQFVKKVKQAEEAYDRKRYKEEIEGKIVGALSEYYKSRLATKNGFTYLVVHWNSEFERIIGKELEPIIRHHTSFKDKSKAIQEVISEYQTDDKSFRTYAYNDICKVFKVKKLKHAITDNDAADFWKAVQWVVKNSL